MDVQITLGNAFEIVSILGMGAAILWRAAVLTSALGDLRKAVDKLEPHGVTVPLLAQRVSQLEIEVNAMRIDKHNLANTVQWLVGRLEDIAPREPSRPDLSVERDPRRR